MPSFFGGSGSSAATTESPEELKATFMKQVQAEAAMSNARSLISVGKPARIPIFSYRHPKMPK
jgi:hypothetical protein